MTLEEQKKQKEDAAKAAREKADVAHQAVADDPNNEAKRKEAEDAEDLAAGLQAEADAIVIPAPDPKDEDKDTDDDKDIDFEDELRDLEGGGKTPPADPPPQRTDREKAERALHFQSERVRELGGDPEAIVKGKKPNDPPPPPAPKAEPQDMSNYVTKDDVAAQRATAMSRSDAEKKVILWHYKHTIQKTGDVDKDIENAYLIANKGKITRSISEIRRAADARQAPPSGSGRSPKAPLTQTPALSAGDQATLRRRGYTPRPDGTWEARRYTVRYDHTKKGWITEKKK